MSVEEELQDAYNKLDAAEMHISRMKKHANYEYKVLQILIAAGFLTDEKLDEARTILNDLPEND